MVVISIFVRILVQPASSVANETNTSSCTKINKIKSGTRRLKDVASFGNRNYSYKQINFLNCEAYMVLVALALVLNKS